MTASKSNASTGSTRYLDVVSSREFQELVLGTIIHNRKEMESLILNVSNDSDDIVMFSRNTVRKKVLIEYDKFISDLENKFSMSLIGEGQTDYTAERVRENITKEYRESKK